MIHEDKDIKRYGNGWLKIVKDIYIVSLKGSDYEMGLQYGSLLKKECENGAISFFSKFTELTIKHSKFGSPLVLRKTALKYLELKFKKPLLKLIKDDEIQFFMGMSEALGHNKKFTRDNLILTDFFMSLPAFNFGGKKEFMRLANVLGCTSFGASPVETKNNHTISGHNKDFAAMEYWDKFQVATFYQPENGFRYMNLSGAGIPISSTVSMNEHGLCISGHVIITSDPKFKGVPIFIIGDRIMKHCRDTKSAVAELSKLNTPTGWKIHIIDKKGIHAVVEITATQNEHYYVKDLSGCANVYKSGKAKEVEMNINQSMMNNYEARQDRVEELLDKFSGKITPETGAKILGDRFDIFTKTERPVGNVIGQMTNLNSIIFDHTDMKFWVASGRAPVCDNVYRGFNFECGFTGNFKKLPKDIKGTYNKSKLNRSVRECIYANNSHLLDFDIKKSVTHIANAEKLTPDEVIYPILKGLLMLQLKKYSDALKSFERAIGLKHEPNKAHVMLLWTARTYDLLGNRDKAVRFYRIVSKTDGVFIPIKKAALKGLKKKYSSRSLKTLPVDFWLGDTLEY